MGPVVGEIQNQPHTAEEKINHLQNDGGIAVFVYIERSGCAHGTNKKGMQMIGRKDKKKQGNKLKTKGIGYHGRNEVGSPLEA
jgi:hypothetical protein